MNIRQKFYIPAIAIGALALASISACNKDKGDGGGSGGGGVSASADMLTFLPKDTAIVVGVSWGKGKNSALFKKFEDKILAGIKDDLKMIEEKCGLNPLDEVNAMVVAISDIQKQDDAIVAIKTKLTQEKVEDCFVKAGGTVADGVYSINNPMNVYWPSKDIMLFSKGIKADGLKSAAASGSIKDNEKTMGLIGKIKSNATVWAVGEIPAMAKGLAAGMGATAPDGAYLSVAIGSGADANLGAVFASEKDATGAMMMVNMGLTAGKQDKKMGAVLKNTEVKQDGDTIIIDIKLSGDQLGELINNAR